MRSVTEGLAAVADERRGALEATSLRHRIRDGADVAARLATDGRHGLDAFEAAVDLGRLTGTGLRRLGRLDPAWGGRLASLLALMNGAPADRVIAHELFSHLDAVVGVTGLPRETLWVYAQLAARRGDDRVAMRLARDPRLPDDVRAAVVADVLHPTEGVDPSRDWMDALSAVMGVRGPEALDLCGTPGPDPFDRLGVVGPLPGRDGPLVTVIMPVYAPGPELLTAVRSVCTQTWGALECVIVDDGSPPGHEHVLEQAVALDDRVRILRMDVNGGTYVARNAGLDAANGEFVAFQDADDWSHPRRLERQLEPLLGDTDVMATQSLAMRVDPDLWVTDMRRVIRPWNESSLCLRREHVKSRIGYFDAVRKGGDSEYRMRIQAAFGGGVLRLGDSPALAVIRRSPGSLSRAAFTQGWRDRARWSYRAAYERWHATADTLYVPSGERAGGVPASPLLVHSRGNVPTRSLDLLVVADWRDGAGADLEHLAASSEVRAAAAAGQAVGIAHVQSLERMSVHDLPTGRTFTSILDAGLAVQVHLHEPVAARELVVIDPSWLQHRSLEDPCWTVEAVRVVAVAHPVDVGAGRVRYRPTVCDETARALFAVTPRWSSPSPTTLGVLQADDGLSFVDGDVRRIGFPCGGPVGGPQAPTEHWRPATIGRWSAGQPLDFVAGAEALMAAYGAGAGAPVLVGAQDVVRAAFERPPAGWTILAPLAMPLEELLDRADILVQVSDPRRPEDDHPVLLRAAERGIPVITGHRHRARLGDLAAYASPQEVPDMVDALSPGRPGRAARIAAARRAAEASWSSPWPVEPTRA